MKRALKISGYLLALAASLIGAVCWLAYTAAGLQFISVMAEHFIPGLELRAVNGRLIDRVDIGELRYQQDVTHVHINHFSFHWSPWQLLENKLHIHTLRVGSATIKTPSAPTTKSSSSAPTTLPQLPLNIIVDDFKLQKTQINDVSIKHLTFAGEVNNKSIHLRAFSILTDKDEVQASGKLMWRKPYQADFKITGKKKKK